MSSSLQLKKLTDRYGFKEIQNDLNWLKKLNEKEKLKRLVLEIQEKYSDMDLNHDLGIFLEKYEFFSQFGDIDSLYEIYSLLEDED